jgi:hypothetical protein
MRQPLLVAIAGMSLGAVLASPGVAVASHDPSGEPFGEDFAAGFVAPPFACGGVFPCFRTSFSIDAHSGPSGENPSGTVVAAMEEQQGGVSELLETRVTCLAASGNRATIGIDATGDGVGDVLLFVEDDGGLGQDRLAYTLNFGGSVCTTSPPTSLPLADGDVTVHDAVPLPTSKDQCRNGAWRNYGTSFKNEGLCVAFVQRGVKPAP